VFQMMWMTVTHRVASWFAGRERVARIGPERGGTQADSGGYPAGMHWGRGGYTWADIGGSPQARSWDSYEGRLAASNCLGVAR
jgi:hypothetical protein